MRRTFIYSSAGLIFVAAGLLGYHWMQPAGFQGTVSTQTHSPSSASLATGTDGAPDHSAPAMTALHEPATASRDGFDRTAMASTPPGSGKHFRDTPVGRALDQHLLILVDVN